MSSNLDVGPFGGGNTAVFQEVRSAGVAGQNFDSLSDQIVQFNTEVVPKSFVSLSSNQFTFDEGIYRLSILITGIGASNPRAFQIWAKDTSNVSYNGDSLMLSPDLDSIGYTILYLDLVIPSGGRTIEILAKCNVGTLSNSTVITPTNGDNYYQKLYATKVG